LLYCSSIENYPRDVNVCCFVVITYLTPRPPYVSGLGFNNS
jgi:hypothetical protein